MGLTSDEAYRRLNVVGANSLSVEPPSIALALFEEFFNWFYIYQVFCLISWTAFHYWAVGGVILLVVVVSGLVKVCIRQESQRRVQSLTRMHSAVTVLVSPIQESLTVHN